VSETLYTQTSSKAEARFQIISTVILPEHFGKADEHLIILISPNEA